MYRKVSLVFQQLLLLLVRAYRLGVSPLMGNHCRHVPTCSDYTMQAVRHHGSLRGGWMGVKRILRCHPWAKASFDPVPEVENRHVCRQGSNIQF